jgi:multiple sugar transport system substrate-binding protein
MSEFNRRRFLESSAGVAAAATGGHGRARSFAPFAQAQTLSFKPEKGAKLRVLRWSRFVQGDIDAYMANVKKFTEKTGIEVRVDNEGWEDVRPKAAVAANTGAGPDIILSTNDDANLYPDKLLDVTDLAEYLGKKYGGWYPAGEASHAPRRQEVAGPAARRRRLADRVPREHGEGRGLQRPSRRPPTISSSSTRR